jgi:hypothetical protein
MSADFAVHQESDDLAHGRVVRIAIAGLLVGTAAVAVSTALLTRTAPVGGDTRPGTLLPSVAEISEVEQTPIDVAKRGLDLRHAQLGALERWQWIDRDAGIASIPIERAMDIVIREGP